MKAGRRDRTTEAFFLKASIGERFCLYHAPDPDRECLGSFLYVHPFAEEMNKSRRMAALQARYFASVGFGVLEIDLFGCGDSSGDFADARWQIWKDDLLLAANWLEDRAGKPTSLWGLRTGALLALDLAVNSGRAFDKLVLWQPVTSGEAFLTQFLRMRLASEMLASAHEKIEGTQDMRNRMAAGESLEVAGYTLAPELAASLDGVSAADLIVTNRPVHWFELVTEAGRPMPPIAARIANTWDQRGVDLHRHLVTGPAFWASQEITECPELLTATTSLSVGAPS